MGIRKQLIALTALCAIAIPSSLAAGLPEKQPNFLHIWRESVKPGRAEEHAKNEAGYVAAFEKANSPGYSLALISDTGPDEAWYVSTWDSNAALGDFRKSIAKDQALGAELSRLDRIDSEYITSVQKILARGRPDLSVGQFPNIAQARSFEILTYRVRPGHQDQFAEAAKAYAAAVKRAGTKTSGRVYEVISGAPMPTYLVFTSVENDAGFDQLAEDQKAIWKAATPDEQATVMKFHKDSVLEEEGKRFTLDPAQSYVPKETRAKDPEFWSKK